MRSREGRRALPVRSAPMAERGVAERGVAEPLVVVDDPRPTVRRLTLNRPKKRNALSNALRGELFAALRDADADRGVHVVVIRGAGSCFSAGYDLAQDPAEPLPWPISRADGAWARHVVQGWFEMWDMATPLIAQVHGFCLAGGTELASACDLVYVATRNRVVFGAADLDALKAALGVA